MFSTAILVHAKGSTAFTTHFGSHSDFLDFVPSVLIWVSAMTACICQSGRGTVKASMGRAVQISRK